MKFLLVAAALVSALAVQGTAFGQSRGGSVVVGGASCAYQLDYYPESNILVSSIWCDDGFQDNWSGRVELPPGVFR